MEHHFKGVNETERYNNDVLNEIRKTNQLLAQLISIHTQKPKEPQKKRITKTRKKV